MRTATTKADLDQAPGVLVPTMGALHAGHESLIRLTADHAEKRNLPGGCTVSIYVNESQFNDPADFAAYPRDLDRDLAICKAAGATTVFLPTPDEMNEAADTASPTLPAVAKDPGLEDAHRPGHFQGVISAVAALFYLVAPAAAVFGEKDWQQLQVVKALAADRAAAGKPPIDIIPGPTIREPDGLALSSRNAHLRPGQRRRATALSCALDEARAATAPISAEEQMRITMLALGVSIDYAAVRDARTLLPVPYEQIKDRPLRALVAGRIGDVRLLDNAPWRPAGE